MTKQEIKHSDAHEGFATGAFSAGIVLDEGLFFVLRAPFSALH